MGESRFPLDCWTFAGWEPNRQYRRMGRSGTIYFGNGAWVPEWRARVCSRDTIRMMADCGVNIAVTHFYKGMGIETERSEWDRLAAYVATCHEEGVRVLGYVQGRSVYYETVLAEEPDCMDWVARERDGSIQCWGGQYYRPAPCLACDEYRDYFKRVLRIGLEEIDLDGVHNDNSYYQHCYCDRCVRLFREWLGAMPDLEERTGLPTADHVLPPPIKPYMGAYSDPLRIAWLEFGTQVRLKALGEFYETIKSVKPEAIYVTNPAFPRRFPWKARHGLDPAREGTVCDGIFGENQNLPRADEGRIVSQAEAYLFADAGDYFVLSTTWRHTPQGSRPAETPGLLWTGLAEEFSYHGAKLGNNWLLRATGDHGALLGDNAPLRETFAEAARFFNDLAAKVDLTGRRQWSEIGLYLNTDSLSLSGATDMTTFRAALSWFLERRIPVRFIYPGSEVPGDISTLLVLQQSLLSDGQMTELSAFARREGKTVILAGESGLHDEWFVARSRSDWLAWRGSEDFVADAGERLQWAAYDDPDESAQYFRVDRSPECDLELSSLLSPPHWRPRFRADLPGHVLVNVETNASGALLIHLRDQAGTEEDIVGARVHLDADLLAGRGVKMYAPDREPETVREAREGDADVSPPAFRRYALLVVG